jgi:hypothetical protein
LDLEQHDAVELLNHVDHARVTVQRKGLGIDLAVTLDAFVLDFQVQPRARVVTLMSGRDGLG